MDMAQRLQELRKTAGYSQEQVADLLDISRQAVSKWESGQGKPDLDNIVKLTEIYKVSADYIISGREYQNIVPSPDSRQSKAKLDKTTKIIIGVIAIIASTALVTVLFITALGLLAKYGI